MHDKTPTFMDVLGVETDLLPLAIEALALSDVGDVLSPEVLVGYVQRYYCGGCQSYIRKADLHPGVDRQTLICLCVRVTAFASESVRRTQIANPAIVRMRPVAQFWSDARQRCTAAERLGDAAFFRPDRIPRIPLSGCRLGPCFCSIRTLGHRDLSRLGIALEKIVFLDPEHL